MSRLGGRHKIRESWREKKKQSFISFMLHASPPKQVRGRWEMIVSSKANKKKGGREEMGIG